MEAEKTSENTPGNSSEEAIEKRKEQLKQFLSSKKGLFILPYVLLAVIVYVGVYIRTRNLPGLKDITTGTWTLGPDLDPFLFLRWAEYIVAHGNLMAIDTMRYVPLGFNTAREMKLLSFFIVWFYQFLSIFSKEVTVTYAAIILPVVAFALTVIAFFFMTREIFGGFFSDKRIPNAIALLASAFLTVVPALLPRTIAGIPEKESVGFLFIFLAFYFSIKSFKNVNLKKSVISAVFAGISTAILGLVWGGITFVFMAIGVSVFFYFMLGQMKKKELLAYILWIVTFMPLMIYFSSRYTIINLVASTSTIPIFATLALILFDIYIYPYAKKISFIGKTEEKFKLPRTFVSIILTALILLISATAVLGTSFVIGIMSDVFNHLLNPLSTNRVAVTVAENKQPFFNGEWKQNFGPVFGTIPLFFTLFFIGSVLLMFHIFKKIEIKERVLITISYFVFISGIIFSRYSSSSVLDGISFASKTFYFGGMMFFVCSFVYVFFRYSRHNKLELLRIDYPLILLLVFFFISLVAARGAIRLIMVLVPSAAVIASYFVITPLFYAFKTKEDTAKVLMIAVAIILMSASFYSIYQFYGSSVSQASVYYPNIYTQQWQKAMEWVRNSTPETAVFGHWWDYGYWVQSMGKRATVVDGGNSIIYWNHMMGRYVLTSPEDNKALEFLYAHNTTHFLIDSTDIGKYTAFSSIGSNKDYDRASYLPQFFLNEQQTQETKLGIVEYYLGGAGIDDDIFYENNGTKITLVKENSGIGAIMIEKRNGSISQPTGIFVSNGKQVNIPLRYLDYNNHLYDFGAGFDAGFFAADSIVSSGGQMKLVPNGGGFYLSPRVVHSFLARKYLFEEEGNFKLVHTESHPIIENLRQGGNQIDEFVFVNGEFAGPIKIWEIEYPSNVQFKSEYLETKYPEDIFWS